MKHFTLNELTRSDTATRLHIDNTPDEAAVAALNGLVDNVLDPLREALGMPITVTSGYRCPQLNKVVGGVYTSQHQTGHAADVTTGDRVLNRKLFQLIQDLKLPFDQLIDEKNFAWVHVSHDERRGRRQVLKL